MVHAINDNRHVLPFVPLSKISVLVIMLSFLTKMVVDIHVV